MQKVPFAPVFAIAILALGSGLAAVFLMVLEVLALSLLVKRPSYTIGLWIVGSRRYQ